MNRLVLGFRRVAGPLMVVGGVLLMVGGLVYWGAGWRYGGAVAIWTAEWALPTIGLGVGLIWIDRLAAGLVAVGAGFVGLLLIVLGEVTGAYGSFIVPCSTLDIMAAALGVAILFGYTRRTGKNAVNAAQPAAAADEASPRS